MAYITMRSQPLVSIGLTTWNRANILHEAIESLLAQTYQKFELIICDHSSPDNTEEICRKYENIDNRIRYYRTSRTITAVENFNYALSKAKGEYFMWAADDDHWDKKYIETLLKLLQHNREAIIAASNVARFTDSTFYNYMPHHMTSSATHLECIIHYLQTGRITYFYSLYKTSILKKTRGYHSDFRPFFQGSDFLTIFKVLMIGKIAFTDKVLFSQRDSTYYTQRFESLKKLDFNKQILTRVLRYSTMPIFYTIDLFLCLRCTLQSSFSMKEKIIIIYYIWIHFFNNLKEYTFTITKGILSFIHGIVKKSFL